MQEYTIRYRETYQKIYTVKANSLKEAKEKLWEDLFEGREEGPKECIDSSMEELKPFYFTFGADPEFPYQNGYLIVYAPTLKKAVKKFQEKYPNRAPKILNCSSVYSQSSWKKCELSEDKDYPCYEVL